MAIPIENRNFFRHYFTEPIEANARIVRIREQKVDTNILTAQIQDLSAGGLCFITDLNFPVTPSIVFNFKFKLLDQSLNLCGSIVRKIELENNTYQYGLQFTSEENMHEHVIQLLNRIMIRKNKGKVS